MSIFFRIFENVKSQINQIMKKKICQGKNIFRYVLSEFPGAFLHLFLVRPLIFLPWFGVNYFSKF
jgi:hypothetical protein